MFSPLRTLREALPSLPSISTLPCCSSSCTRARLISFSCCAKNKSRRFPLASLGTVIRRKRASSSAMGDLCGGTAPQPQETAPQHHQCADQLRGQDAVAAQKCQQKAGEAAKKKQLTEDFSIVMRAIEHPHQYHKEYELNQAGIKLGRMKRHSQRGSSHDRRTAKDHRPGQVGRRSIITAGFQAGNRSNRTLQCQTGSKGIGGSPQGQVEARGINHSRGNRDRHPCQADAGAMPCPGEQGLKNLPAN